MQKHTKDDKTPLAALADARIDLGAYRIADPEAFGRNFLRLMEESTRAMQGLLERAQHSMGPYTLANEWTEAVRLTMVVVVPPAPA